VSDELSCRLELFEGSMRMWGSFHSKDPPGGADSLPVGLGARHVFSTLPAQDQSGKNTIGNRDIGEAEEPARAIRASPDRLTQHNPARDNNRCPDNSWQDE
jgi:hypothetical protein